MASIINLLITDHATIRSLLRWVMADPRPADAAQLFAAFYELTSVHLRFEQEFVYPLLDRHAQGTASIGKAYEEHAEIRTLLEALNRLDDDATGAAMLSVLSVDLDHHFADEERDLLPQLRKRIDRATLDTLGEDYQAAKDFALPDSDMAYALAWSHSW